MLITNPLPLTTWEQFQLGQELIDLARRAPDPSAAIAEQEQRWQRAGRLPMGAASELALEPIRSPVKATLRHLAPLAQWEPCPEGLEIDLDLAVQEDELKLEDWLGEVSTREGEYALIRTSPQAVVSDQKPRWHRLLRLWVELLAGCAQGYSLCAWLVGPDQLIQLAPLPQEEARQQLSRLMEKWLEGMQQPAPLACKTALTLLSASPDKARKEAISCYEGGYNSVGERDQDPALARVWPDTQALFDAGLERWAEILYQPLLQHARVVGPGALS